MVSILENAGRIGLPIPPWLLDKLAVIRKEFPLEPIPQPDEATPPTE
jgi:phage-related holin